MRALPRGEAGLLVRVPALHSHLGNNGKDAVDYKLTRRNADTRPIVKLFTPRSSPPPPPPSPHPPRDLDPASLTEFDADTLGRSEQIPHSIRSAVSRAQAEDLSITSYDPAAAS